MTRRKSKLFAALAGLLLSAFCLCGCSPEKKVARHLNQLRYEWQTNVIHQANLPERVLAWNEAIEIMLQNNLKLKQSRMELTTAEEAVRQVFKDLIPTLNLRSGVSKQLTSLDRITADDVTFSANSFFSIPGLVNFSARLYAARLGYLRAHTAYQLAEREQIIDLYRLFNGAEELRQNQTRFSVQQATASAMQQVDPFSGRLMLTELQSREIANEREVESLQDRASALLGSRDYRWIFSTNGLPELRYHEFPLPLTDTNRVAQLQLKLLALELEAARATLQGLKLRYWPELNIFITGPPIYQRYAGEARWWDADALRMNADLFWSVDTRGSLRRMIRQTTRQQALQIERYRQETLSLMNRLMFTQQLIDSVQEQLNRVNLQIQVLLSVPPSPDFLAIERYAQDYRMLTEEQLRLRRELAELNALFWFVDEEAWAYQSTILPDSTRL